MIDPALVSRLTAEASADGVAQLVVGALVASEGTVLLLKRPVDDFMGGIFELPSGKVEPGEDLGAALAREVFEETGLRATAVGAYLGAFDYLSGSGKKSRQFNFAVLVDSHEPVVLQEHDEYRWASVSEKLPVTDAVQKVFEAYRRGRTTLQVTTTTADRASAAELAHSAVAARLAASAQVSGPVTSFFWHLGELGEGEEWLVTLKTTAERYPELESLLRREHPWDNPEVTAVALASASADYLAWLHRTVKS